MKNLTGQFVAAGVGLALSATILTTVAAHQFSGLTTTAGGYSTYDADQVNSEDVAQTGHGVYVAVLDTGLVPNYKDYFPTARVDTSLGTGFDQALHISGAENPCDLSVAVGPLTHFDGNNPPATADWNARVLAVLAAELLLIVIALATPSIYYSRKRDFL